MYATKVHLIDRTRYPAPSPQSPEFNISHVVIGPIGEIEITGPRKVRGGFPVASVLCSLHGCTRAKFARRTVPGHDCEMITKEAPWSRTI